MGVREEYPTDKAIEASRRRWLVTQRRRIDGNVFKSLDELAMEARGKLLRNSEDCQSLVWMGDPLADPVSDPTTVLLIIYAHLFTIHPMSGFKGGGEKGSEGVAGETLPPASNEEARNIHAQFSVLRGERAGASHDACSL